MFVGCWGDGVVIEVEKWYNLKGILRDLIWLCSVGFMKKGLEDVN